MKKKNFKSLNLNKKAISNLSVSTIKGQGPDSVDLTCTGDFTRDAECINYTKFAGCFHSLDTVCEVTDKNGTCSPNTNFVCFYSDIKCNNADTLN